MPLWDGPPEGHHEQRFPHPKRRIRERANRPRDDRMSPLNGRRKECRRQTPKGNDLSSAPKRLSLKSLANCTSILRSNEPPRPLFTRVAGAEWHPSIPRRRQDEDLDFGRHISGAFDENALHSFLPALIEIEKKSD